MPLFIEMKMPLFIEMREKKSDNDTISKINNQKDNNRRLTPRFNPPTLFPITFPFSGIYFSPLRLNIL